MAFLRPTADVSDGSWTTDTGGTTLYAAIDETTQSDTDYVKSSENPVNDIYEFNLGPPTALLSSGIVRFAIGKLSNNAVPIDIKVQIKQGSTTIAEWTYLDVAFGFTPVTETLTLDQRNLVVADVDVHAIVIANPPTSDLALDLDFLNMTPAYEDGSVLDERITFSRTSGATLFDSDGVLRNAPHNLFLHSQDFTHADWSSYVDPSASGSKTANSDVAPDGTTTATLHTINRSTTDQWVQGAQQEFTGTVASYTASIWFKAFDGDHVGRVIDFAIRGSGSVAVLQISLPAEWTRYELTRTMHAGTCECYFGYTSSADGNWTGEGTQTGETKLYAWGAQVELNPSASEYIATTSSAIYGPRLDHDPSTLAPRGLLVEMQRTNLLTQSANTSHSDWSPYIDGGNTSNRTANSAVSPDGTTTATLHTIDRATTNWCQAGKHNFTGTAAAHTGSIWLKAFDGGNVGRVIDLALRGNTATTVLQVALPAEWTRYTVTETLFAGTSEFFFGYASGSDSNFNGEGLTTGETKFYAWGGQVELGNFATSYIPTTTAAVTRAADDATMTGANFSDWWNAIEGTFVLDHSIDGGNADGRSLFIWDQVSDNESMHLAGHPITSGYHRLLIYDGGVGQLDEMQHGPLTVGVPFKLAFAFKLNDVAYCKDGGALLTDTTVTIPTVNELRFAQRQSDYRVARSHFRSLQFYNTRITNAELQELTSPALELDFITRNLDPRITFSRASAATYFNRDGVLRISLSGAARFDYDPGTLERRGLLMEEQRTNLILHSGDMNNAEWITFANGTGTVSRSGNAEIAPDGTTTAALCTVDRSSHTASWAQAANQDFTGTVAGYTGSVWLKAFAAGDVGKIIDVMLAGNAVATVTQAVLTADWVRYTVSRTLTASSCEFIIGYAQSTGYIGTGNQLGETKFYVWGAQVEVGAFATSYIPTTTASVTRATEFGALQGTNFSSWYNATEGTIVCDFEVHTINVNQTIFQINDNTANNAIFYSQSASNAEAGIRTGGSEQITNYQGDAIVAGKVAIAYKANDSAVSKDGSTPTADTSVTIPTVSQLLFGAVNNQYPSAGRMWIREFDFYSYRLSDTVIQELTTPG